MNHSDFRRPEMRKFYKAWQWRNNYFANERPGQACYNAAYESLGSWVEEASGTPYDPFNNDKVIPEFLQWLIDKTESL